MAVPMPAVVVLMVCKVVLGAPDDNSQATHWMSSEWDMSGGVMHCRREEVQLYDPAVDQGAQARPYNQWACNNAGVSLGTQFDVAHWDKPVRFWKFACPVPIVNGQSGEIVGWKIPECPESNGTVVCEKDSAI
ncbi:MAG TPA: hypothetical protein VIY48_07435 [Candidatus Paceibacterota bacterium]